MLRVLKENKLIERIISYGSLFTSLGTLLCCALPASLVLLGMGASLANLLSSFPELIWLSENKGWVFGVSFALLALSFLFQNYAQKLSCPIDKKEDCEETRKWSKSLLYISLGINIIGASYAFLLPRLLNE